MTKDLLVGGGLDHPGFTSRQLELLVEASLAAKVAGESATEWWVRVQSGAGSVPRSIQPDEPLGRLLATVQVAVASDCVSVLVANETGDELVARISIGLAEQVTLGLRITPEMGLVGAVPASGETLVIDDLSSTELESPILRDAGIRAVVAVPLIADGRLLGVLHAGSKTAGQFGPGDADLLSVVADRLATSIERVRLFESERVARATAEELAARVGRLQAITVALSADLDSQAVAELVQREVAPSLWPGLASCTLWLNDGSKLRLLVDRPVPASAMPFAEIGLDSELPAADVVRSGEALWLESLAEQDRRYPRLAGVRFGEVLGVLPLRASGNVLGVLALSFAEGRAIERAERDFFQAVAEQAAEALDRARLREIEARVAEHNGFLAETSSALASSLDYRETLDKVVRLTIPRLGDLATVHLFDAVGALTRVAVAHRNPFIEGAIRAAGPEPGDTAVAGLLAEVVRKRAIMVADAARLLEDQGARASEAAAALAPLGVSSALLVPLISNDNTLGVLSLARIGDSAPLAVHDRQLAEEVARRAAVAIDNARLHSSLQAARRSQGFLLDVGKVLARARGYRGTLEQLAAVAVPTLGDLCLIDIVSPTRGLQRMVSHHTDPARQPLADELRERFPPDPEGGHPSAEAVRTGRSMFSRDMTDEFLHATCRSEEHVAVAKALGFTSFMAVPLLHNGEVLGAITLVSAGSGRRFDLEDLGLAEELAEQVAAVVDNARRSEQDRHTAHVLQASLLPSRVQDVPGVKLATRYLAGTRETEVGGDFYDVVKLPDGLLVLMIGDVAGHDQSAAAMMGRLRSAARALLGQVQHPFELLHALQQSWEFLDFDRLATAIFCTLDPSSGAIVMANAGHPPPLIASASGASFVTVEPAPPLGVPSREVSEWSGTLRNGETLLLYTDGLIENRSGHLDVAMAELARVAGRSAADPEALCDEIIQTMGSDRSDDVSLLAATADRGGPG
jgi:serine/threonine-protein kinase RsbW